MLCVQFIIYPVRKCYVLEVKMITYPTAKILSVIQLLYMSKRQIYLQIHRYSYKLHILLQKKQFLFQTSTNRLKYETLYHTFSYSLEILFFSQKNMDILFLIFTYLNDYSIYLCAQNVYRYMYDFMTLYLLCCIRIKFKYRKIYFMIFIKYNIISRYCYYVYKKMYVTC